MEESSQWQMKWNKVSNASSIYEWTTKGKWIDSKSVKEILKILLQALNAKFIPETDIATSIKILA